MKNAKAERFFATIFAVKNYSRGFQHVHVSFQPTSSCNIASVNDLSEFTEFIELREKGRGKYKHQCVIEMNHDRRIYLATCCWINVLDGRIQNNHIFYIVWKYWHSTINHFLAITVAYACTIYLELCEGLLCTFWKVACDI